jgi:hypothetical protein
MVSRVFFLNKTVAIWVKYAGARPLHASVLAPAHLPSQHCCCDDQRAFSRHGPVAANSPRQGTTVFGHRLPDGRVCAGKRWRHVAAITGPRHGPNSWFNSFPAKGTPSLATGFRMGASAPARGDVTLLLSLARATGPTAGSTAGSTGFPAKMELSPPAPISRRSLPKKECPVTLPRALVLVTCRGGVNIRLQLRSSRIAGPEGRGKRAKLTRNNCLRDCHRLLTLWGR